ncbi:hypothetical protein F5X68DRAFT_209315 [Plectosphaerella plurivora]|uniref:FHA domain-containing protein n=1 Tax=Plectosphaerella plurivora TaxID=936078 RepID=A0A9P8V871_9PEZI|nr:hypothetical protein F5X68DRAFT_209315 [Plectosphaerella plurivora]
MTPRHASGVFAMDSSPPPKTLTQEPVLPVAGVKRPAPSLLPPFEPLSSSPGFPRPLKRQARAGSVGSTHGARLKYPTPVPTSSTGILSSSPPRAAHVPTSLTDASQPPPLRRPTPLARTASGSAPERAPLASVPAVELHENGDVILMGRSSNSSHYQLSGNRLVSRVHVKARYIPASTPLAPNKVEIICNGWNGLKLHCQGRTWELLKGDSFTSETEGTEIMLDVHEARVMVQWPKRDARDALGHLSDSSWDDSPRSQARGANGNSNILQASPLRRATRIVTPESPTLATNGSSQRLQGLLPGSSSGEIQIFEDPSADDASPVHGEPGPDMGQSFLTEVTRSFSSDLSDPNEEDAENDPDEENDPIVHSFGPFGADLSNRLASITASSPKFISPKPRPSLGELRSSKTLPRISEDLLKIREPAPLIKEEVEEEDQREEGEVIEEEKPLVVENPAVSNHVVNQLAYSRLSSTPLSTIMTNLPIEERRDLSKDHLRAIIEGTACIGTIRRQGKDAAGKPLESEYYYMPEADDDENRRLAVTDGLRKPSLRACRKQHKQYYWKRPRTP